MKITIDQNICVECGTCKSICHSVFDLNEEGKAYVKENADLEKFAESVKNAINICPAQAIIIKEL
ncbi:MAG: ferredoxin [bacterium]